MSHQTFNTMSQEEERRVLNVEILLICFYDLRLWLHLLAWLGEIKMYSPPGKYLRHHSHCRPMSIWMKLQFSFPLNVTLVTWVWGSSSDMDWIFCHATPLWTVRAHKLSYILWISNIHFFSALKWKEAESVRKTWTMANEKNKKWNALFPVKKEL